MLPIPDLIAALKQGTEHLLAIAQKHAHVWNPEGTDPRVIHNNYARNLVTCYVSKFADLSGGLIDAIEKQNFLTYALCGRGLIENVATLRYYVQHQYKPIFDKGQLSVEDYKKLLEIDDKHLRGSRFDWESFLFKRYSELKDDAVQYLKDKKQKNKKIAEGLLQEQFNAVTCVEKWALESPEILIAYNLFCDLVHPNIGSSFLVASTSTDGLFFSRFKGTPVGESIFEQSFPILMSITYKPFGDQLTMLIATIWPDDEL